MKSLLILALFILSFNSLTAQEVSYSDNGERLIITSEKVMLSVYFRDSEKDASKNYEDSKTYSVGRNKIVMPVKYLKENDDQVIINYGVELVVLEIE